MVPPAFKYHKNGSCASVPESVIVLEGEDGKKIYVVGISFSSQSIQDVQSTIQCVNPQIIVFELCKNSQQFFMANINENDNSFYNTLNSITLGFDSFLQSFYSFLKNILNEKNNLSIGAEFETAFLEASKIQAEVLFGDRPIEITLSRAFHKLSMWEKMKSIYFFIKNTISHFCLTPNFNELKSSEEEEKDIENDIENDIKENDLLSDFFLPYVQEFPILQEPLITEREIYLTICMKRALHKAQHSVVALVGNAHLPNLTSIWNTSFSSKVLNDIISSPKDPNVNFWKYTSFFVLGIVVGITSCRIFNKK